MAKVIVTAPGKASRRIAGVAFSEGRAEVDTDSAAFQFFRRHGYKVEGEQEQPNESESRDGEGSDEGEQPDEDHADDEDSPEGEQEQPERPHPVQGSKAVWYEHLSKLNPNHGFDLATVSRKELIAAVEAIEAKQH